MEKVIDRVELMDEYSLKPVLFILKLNAFSAIN